MIDPSAIMELVTEPLPPAGPFERAMPFERAPARVPKFKRCKISRQQLMILMQHFGEC